MGKNCKMIKINKNKFVGLGGKTIGRDAWVWHWSHVAAEIGIHKPKLLPNCGALAGLSDANCRASFLDLREYFCF